MSKEHGDDWVEDMALGVVVLAIVVIVCAVGLGVAWIMRP